MFNRHRGQQCRRPICCPPRVMPTQYCPPHVSPTQEVVHTNIFNTVVPYFHPTHHMTVNRHITHNQHYFPQTYSTRDEFVENTQMCGTPENPNPNCLPLRRRRRPFGF